MNLSDAQRAQVAQWIAQGLRVAEVQKKLSTDLGVNLTYMEVRFLIDDLKLKPKDPEPAKIPEAALKSPAPGKGQVGTAESEAKKPGAGGKPAISVDQLTRTGALVSGKVSFGSGTSADWQLDQFGRLGLIPSKQGQKPSQQEIVEFQTALQDELARLGY